MDFLKEKLINVARAKGICAEGHQQMLASADIGDMVGYYVANPDWCLERGFPDLPTLREHFADVGHKGVFVGVTFHGELLNDLQAYVFHDCKGTIKVGLNVEKGSAPMLYLANGCRLHVVGDGPITKEPMQIPIYVFGKNDLSARDNRRVRFKVYRHNVIV